MPKCVHGNPMKKPGCTEPPTTAVYTAGNPTQFYCATHLPEHILFFAEHHPLVVLERL